MGVSYSAATYSRPLARHLSAITRNWHLIYTSVATYRCIRPATYSQKPKLALAERKLVILTRLSCHLHFITRCTEVFVVPLKVKVTVTLGYRSELEWCSQRQTGRLHNARRLCGAEGPSDLTTPVYPIFLYTSLPHITSKNHRTPYARTQM